MSDVEAVISLDIKVDKMHNIKNKNKVVKFSDFIVATGFKKKEKNRFQNLFLKY
jgi:hypothetical protein